MKKLIILIIICAGLIGFAFRPDVQQGNILNPAKIQQLKLNMSKEQVCSILGTPVLGDTFDQNYWTYTYSKQTNGEAIHIQQLTLKFRKNKLIAINGKKPPALAKGPFHF